jgi:hypothetical protein
MTFSDLQTSNAFKHANNIVIIRERTIKKVDEIERYGDDYVLYMTDKTSYGISQCQSIEETFRQEFHKNKEKSL